MTILTVPWYRTYSNGSKKKRKQHPAKNKKRVGRSILCAVARRAFHFAGRALLQDSGGDRLKL